MKKIFIILFTFILSIQGNAQVGIGTTTPNHSAALDISDSTRGLLIPRMSMVKRQAILNPAKGLLVYQTDNPQGIWSYNGSYWSNLTNDVSSGNFTRHAKSTTGNINVVYTNSNAYAFCDDLGATWYPIALTGTPLGAVALDNMVMIYTTTSAFAFCLGGSLAGGAQWYSHAITGTPKTVAGIHDMMVLSTTTNLYGLAYDEGIFSWVIQPLTDNPLGFVTGESTNVGPTGYCIIIYTASSAYAFGYSQFASSQWYPRALSGTPLGGSAAGNQMLVYTSTNAYAFDIVGGGTDKWHPQVLTGTGMGSQPD